MLTTEDLKVLMIHAAYTGAGAVCTPLIMEGSGPDSGKSIPIDPLIRDIGLQNKNLMVYEVAKIHYAAILRAFEDKTGIWPDPKLPAAPAAPKTAAPGNSATPGAGQSTAEKYAQVVEGAAKLVSPILPGADIVAKAVETVAS